MKLLLWTKEDPASQRIAAALNRDGFFAGPHAPGAPAVEARLGAALAEVKGPLVSADFADRAFVAPPGEHFDRALFLSRHSAASGLTALTVHPIGNFGLETRVGGGPRTLAPPDPPAMTALLRALMTEAAPLGINATFEATHHGPRMDIPSLFVEVGSGPEDWENKSYCGAVARAIILAYLPASLPPPGPGSLGLGGGHYHPRHSDRARHAGEAFGHLIPAYALAGTDEATLRTAAEQSRATSVVVDRRSEPAAVDRAAAFLESLGLARTVLGA